MSEEKLFSADEERLIDEAFNHLIDCYLQTKHRKKVEIITKAFQFARQAHKGVRRHSGEPYIMHPLAVAQIVCSEIGLGSTSICSALLHDVVEDTDYTIDDIKNVFGPKIAQIVDGLTKIAGGIFGDKASAQAENFKKLLLTMSDDIRVILIKIADRLHNMRTLEHMLPRKQYKIAGETLYLYAPLAYRLGLNKIKSELEDLSFRFEHPKEYNAIKDKLAFSREELNNAYKDFIGPINDKLQQMGIQYRIMGRIKTPYSIWRKMNARNLSFEEVYDILAVRIIYEPPTSEVELSECFNIYLMISEIYKAHPDRLRDWVTLPKANGYQALHTTLMSNRGQWVEVQIRSTRMDDIAEQGIAAHWKYKAGTGAYDEDENELNKWLETIKEILEDPQPDSMDFLDTIKLNLYSSEIFVFTPKGELRMMPQGSTVLDFAFTIHSQMGTNCIGAKVNQKLEPINYELKSGDQIEILTSKSSKVDAEWLNIVTTAKAKGRIKALLRKEEREYRKFGEALFNEFLHKEDLDVDTNKIEKLCKLHGVESREELMLAIGQKKVILSDSDKSIIKGESSSWYNRFKLSFSTKKKEVKPYSENENNEKKSIDVKKTLVITDQDLHQYKLAHCCHPVPGDSVLAFAEEDGTITIHQRKCEKANKLKSAMGNRILTVDWHTESSLFPVSIYMKGVDNIGTLAKVTEVISEKMNANIKKLTLESEGGLFEGTIIVLVHSLDELENIKKGIKKITNIKTVFRKEE